MSGNGKVYPGVITVRRLRGSWVSCVPWVVMVAQCLVILILLLDPVRRDPAGCHRCAACGGNQQQKSPDEVDADITAQQVNDEVNGQASLGEFPLLLLKDTPQRVFYNRVPKCGSSTMMDLVIEMSNKNNYTFARAPEYMRFFLDEKWQKRFADRVKRVSPPMVYERHLHFLDFRKFGMAQPVYINLVRDPLERLTSWYYFRRYQDGHIRDMATLNRVRTYDECVLGNHSECVEPLGDNSEEGFFKIIPFFCGQEDYCRVPGDKGLLQAIHNVKKYYTVVGIMENYTEFVQALEFVLPKYFKGGSKVYTDLENEWKSRHKTTYKLPTSPEARSIMMMKLKEEYQFYDFLKRRFKKQMAAIKTAQSKG